MPRVLFGFLFKKTRGREGVKASENTKPEENLRKIKDEGKSKLEENNLLRKISIFYETVTYRDFK